MTDKDWEEYLFNDHESEKWERVCYNVTVPEAGHLTLRLMDRGDCLTKFTFKIDSGTSRVGVDIKKILGEDIEKYQLRQLLDEEEAGKFNETFPDFKRRCKIRTDMVVHPIYGPSCSCVASSDNYPQYEELKTETSMGVTLQDGIFRVKAGKAAVLYAWFWGNALNKPLRLLTLDESENLLALNNEGKPSPATEYETPVWALVIKYEPGETGSSE